MSVEIYQLGPDVWEQRFVTTAQPNRVFDYIVDFERHVDWEHELMAVEPMNRRAGTAGGDYLKTYGTRPTSLVERIFASRQRVTCTLTEVDRPHRIVWKQVRSHQAVEPSSFQKLDLVITPSAPGSLIVLTRRFIGIEGTSIDLVARFSSRWGQALSGLPPEVRAAAGASAGDRPGLFSTPDEVVQHALDGHSSRGPGPTSFERLNAILDRKRP